MYTSQIMFRRFQVLVIPDDYPGEQTVLLLEGLTLAADAGEPDRPDEMEYAKVAGLVSVPLSKVYAKPFVLMSCSLLRKPQDGSEARVEMVPLFRRPYIVDLRAPQPPRRYDPAIHQF